MLMVGAGDRNAGKTEFVCSLIRKFSSRYNIIGMKVTSIDAVNSGCPRGGYGCSVCSSLEDHYDITEETNGRVDKDTCRMLAAGAARVFWLRALKTHLKKGILALLNVIGDNAILVCESNSMRRVVEPEVFMMIKDSDVEDWKSSAKDVAQYVDRNVFFDGNEFDIDMDEIELAGGKWSCRMNATAIIMAGGNSNRMGQDKSLLPVRGKPMIKYVYDQLFHHFKEIFVSADNTSKYAFLGAKVIPDRVPDQGPLMGIASVL